MNKILILLSGLVILTSVTYAQSLPAPPEGKNLFSNPAMNLENGRIPHWENHGGAQISLSAGKDNETAFLRAVTSKPGYHLGLARTLPLKPDTEYLYYTIVRGKIAKDSKIVLLYVEGKQSGMKKAAFIRSKTTYSKDFPWSLHSVKFKTPADFSGSAIFYPVLFYGECTVDITNTGLLELKPSIPKNYANILVNPQFRAGQGNHPVDWNSNFEDEQKFFRFTREPDGTNIVTLRPRKKPLVLNQTGIRLRTGKQYRIGATIRTRNLDAKRSGIILYTTAWQKETGTPKLPANTSGWQKLEASVTLPPSPYNMYSFAVYTVDNEHGEIDVKEPFLYPVDDDAAQGIKPAAEISRLYRITPVKPLLADINPENPELIFSFRYDLPGKETDYECRLRTRMNGKKDWSPAQTFPLRGQQIQTHLEKISAGSGTLQVEVVNRITGKIIASETYPFTAKKPVKISRKAEKQLNMLTRRLFTGKTRDGKILFSNPRAGWIYLRLSQGSEKTTAHFPGQADNLLFPGPDHSLETMRYLPAGDQEIILNGTTGGETIVNAVPEIIVYCYPIVPGAPRTESFHPLLVKKHLFPNINTFTHGYGIETLPAGEYESLMRRGIQWMGQLCMLLDYNPEQGKERETPEQLLRRFERHHQFPYMSGFAFDEIDISRTEEKMFYMAAIWKTLPDKKHIYTWSSGVKFMVNGLNTHYFAGAVNNAGGRGKFLFECYSRTQETEARAAEYLEDYLNETIRRAEQLLPGAAEKSFIINGAYTNQGEYNTDTYDGPDVKYFWDMYFHKLANDREFKNLYGVGLYSLRTANEESMRWAMKLFRHYALEGNRDSLAKRYGYKYLPGLVKNGDFISGLTHWQADAAEKDSLQHERIDNFGRSVLRRINEKDAALGDNVCVFRQSAKGPNRLSQKISGLKPGEKYVLRYAVVNRQEASQKKPSGKKYPLTVTLDGAENITGTSPLGKYVGADGITVAGLVNNCALVFQPARENVTITFSDGPADAASGNAGQKLLLNSIRIAPYFAED